MQQTTLLLLLAIFLAAALLGTSRGHEEDLGGGCIFLDQLLDAAEDKTPLELHVSDAPVQNVHLALDGPTRMRVGWLSPRPYDPKAATPSCSFGLSQTSLKNSASGRAYTYEAGGFEQTLNTVLLDLTAMKVQGRPLTIHFRCGDVTHGWGELSNFTLQDAGFPTPTLDASLRFKVFPDGESNGMRYAIDAKVSANGHERSRTSSKPPLVALIGDHGVKNGQYTARALSQAVATENVQLLVHAGDISYADRYGKNNSYIWVEYMRQMEPIASRVPYMVAPGNHEAQFQFAAYLNWLLMPSSASQSESPFWFSFDYLGIHFVSFSTEHDFSPNSTQHKWLSRDLARANQNRKNVPWIIVFGHRPLYCSSVICAERCKVEAPEYRAGLEALLLEGGVDVVVSGHNHQYERSWPVARGLPTQHNYSRPAAPVYIVNGAAGNPEINDPTFRPDVPWRARDDPTFDSGFLLMAPSPTSLHFRYVISKTGKVYDEFTITRA